MMDRINEAINSNISFDYYRINAIHQRHNSTYSNLIFKCHPQCSWKCDDPHCPAICDPVCEPPKCHTSCAEPKNAICDVKCEKPECEVFKNVNSITNRLNVQIKAVKCLTAQSA